MARIPGFTAINRLAEPSNALDAGATNGPAPHEANNGKKRQRKATKPRAGTYKSPKVKRPRQVKKARRLSGPLNVESTSSAVQKESRVPDQPSGELEVNQLSSLTILQSTSTLPSNGAGVIAKPEDNIVPLSNDGLSSVYRAAFDQQQQQQQRPITGKDPNAHLSESQSDECLSPIFLTTPPSDKETLLSDLALPVLSNTESVIHDSSHTVIGSVCQIPCSSGTALDKKHPVAKSSLRTEAGQQNGLAVDHAQSDDIDAQISDDDLLAMAGDDYRLPEIGGSMRSISLSENVNGPDHVSETSLEPPSIFSLSSDVGFSKTSNASNGVGLSFKPSIIKSSSPSVKISSDLQTSSHLPAATTQSYMPSKQSTDEGRYNDEDLDLALLDFQDVPSAQIPRRALPPASDRELGVKPQGTPSKSIAPERSIANLPSRPKQGVVPTTSSPDETMVDAVDVPHKISFDQDGNPIPFIRPPFPDSIRDRSPILGLSSRTFLRTCFRIGEAINAGSSAIRNRTDAVIELYAYAVHSERPPGSSKQLFRFADIFSPEKPPFLDGAYGLWKGVGIWEKDSRVFLGEQGRKRLARVIGRLGREEKTRKLEMTVLSIWEADWEDVGICKGHFCV
ncbi:MAG: hypothetical protein Q9222_004822 [Ikaeria aurantiellina]